MQIRCMLNLYIIQGENGVQWIISIVLDIQRASDLNSIKKFMMSTHIAIFYISHQPKYLCYSANILVHQV